MPGLNLNLKDADLKGFDAIPAGTYDAVVYEASMGETEGGENAKLPKSTPYLNVQFKVEGGEFDNRRVFNKFIIAPGKVDGKPYEHKKMMDGMLAKFFMAIGFSEEEVLGGSFDPDLEDLNGRECRVTVKQREYNGSTYNDVSAVRPRSEVSAGSSLL